MTVEVLDARQAGPPRGADLERSLLCGAKQSQGVASGEGGQVAVTPSSIGQGTEESGITADVLETVG